MNDRTIVDPATQGKLNVFNGATFERDCIHVIKNHPVLSCGLKNVWLYKDWPKRLGRDIGTDIVIEYEDGGLAAVQAKYTSRADLTLNDDRVDRIVTASFPKLKRWIVMTNAANISANVKLCFNSQMDRPVQVLYGSDIAPYMPVPGTDGTVSMPVEYLEPRPDQRDALAKVCKAVANGENRMQVISPCGTGKTLSMYHIAMHIGRDLTVVFAPTIPLCAQNYRKFLSYGPTPFKALVVCSDEQAGGWRNGSDMSLTDTGAVSTTKPDIVASFTKEPGRKIVFCTYQSSPVLGRVLRDEGIAADLLILDEAHETATSNNDSSFQAVLKDEYVPANIRVFTTATPRLIQTRRRAGADTPSVVCMSDVSIYGRRVHELTYKQAVGLKLLVPMRILLVGVRTSEVKAELERYRRAKLDDGNSIAIDRAIAAIAISKASADFDLEGVFTFHNSVASASDFVSALNKLGSDFDAEWIDSNTPLSKREAIYEAMRSNDGKRRLLSSCRIAATGTDVSSLDAVMIVDPTSGVILNIQRAGRCGRIDPTGRKQFGYVILPCVVADDDTDVDGTIAGSSQALIAGVVNALRSQDETITDNILVTGHTGGWGSPLNGRVPGEGPFITVGDVELQRLVQETFIRVMDDEMTMADWSDTAGWSVVKAAIQRDGEQPMWRGQKPGDPRYTEAKVRDILRQRMTDGTLSPELDAEMRAAGLKPYKKMNGPQKRRGKLDTAEMIVTVKAFVAEHGRLPSRGSKDEHESRLGMWISNCNKKFNAGALDAEIQRELEALGKVFGLSKKELYKDPEWLRKRKETNQALAKDPEWLRKKKEANQAKAAANAPYRTEWEILAPALKAAGIAMPKAPNGAAKAETWAAFVADVKALLEKETTLTATNDRG